MVPSLRKSIKVWHSEAQLSDAQGGASAFGARGWNSGLEFRAELRMLYVSCFSNERLCWLRNFARLLSVWVSLVMRLVWGRQGLHAVGFGA